MNYPSQHNFHIPVMGLAFTIDTPVKVARFGISSAISIVENRLIEMMRGHYYKAMDRPYEPISTHEDDFRAKRITDYLNLVNEMVQQQVEKLKRSAFEVGSEIVKYFEMLPDDSALKKYYYNMTLSVDERERKKMEDYLRTQVHPGSIDVNIMTKTDRDNYHKDGSLVEDGSDAVAALRGYTKSDLTNSSVIFSAGTNLRLYNYLENCDAFQVNDDGGFNKKIIIKVSDYRSALIQGKYLAKKAVWVSEFRIESGLNCGGHAFATEGNLMGPILEEFREKRQELIDSIFEIYNTALERKCKRKFIYAPEMKYSVQGGIGNYEEDEFLHRHYQVNSTGWGTPFLLVPEATTVDDETLGLLSAAKEKDVVLSRNSPFGVRFYYLKGTSAEKEKLRRIANGNPGSPCTEKHLAFNTEFTKIPICTASQKYQKLKLAQLQTLDLPKPEYNRQVNEVLDKECLCIGLSNSAARNYSTTLIKNMGAVNICPGPNIVNFSRVVSLQAMVDHIYGRKNIIAGNGRPHMFVRELQLYVEYLKEQLPTDQASGQFSKKKKYYAAYFQNLREGIRYYQSLPMLAATARAQFLQGLNEASEEIELLDRQFKLYEKQ